MTTATIALNLTHWQRRIISERAQDLMARASVAGLFLALAWTLGVDFMETRRPTDLLLVVGEALVVILTCLRKRAQTVDCRTIARVMTAVSMVSPLLIRPAAGDPIVSELVASTIAALGLTIVILGKMSVGSSRVDLQACKLEYSIVSPK